MVFLKIYQQHFGFGAAGRWSIQCRAALLEVDGVALFPLCWVGAHAGVCGSLYRSDSGLGHAISLSHSRLTCTFSSLAALSLQHKFFFRTLCILLADDEIGVTLAVQLGSHTYTDSTRSDPIRDGLYVLVPSSCPCDIPCNNAHPQYW